MSSIYLQSFMLIPIVVSDLCSGQQISVNSFLRFYFTIKLPPLLVLVQMKFLVVFFLLMFK